MVKGKRGEGRELGKLAEKDAFGGVKFEAMTGRKFARFLVRLDNYAGSHLEP
jgi:hypothetical protein